VGVVDNFKIILMMIEIMTRLVKIPSDNWPRFLEKKIVEPIRIRSFVIRKLKDDIVNFIISKWDAEMFKIAVLMTNVLKVELHLGIH
jgi:hypothetical protein